MEKEQEMQGQYIQLAVPERHYLKVVQYLGRLEAGEDVYADGVEKDIGLQKTPKGRIKANSRPAKKWTHDELSQFKHEITSRRKYLAPLLELMSANPGGWVHKADYEKASGFTGNQLRSALAGMSQFIGKRFERSNWPFDYEWNVNGSSEVSYKMSVEQAEAWNKA
jgi:hypothetical protein